MIYYIVVPVCWVLFRILFRVQVIGKENLVQGRGYILAPNHLSAIDPVFVVTSVHWTNKLVTFAKKELFENWFMNWFCRGMGGVPVRGATKEEKEILDTTIEKCRNGKGLLLFPEGTRSKDGEVGVIKSGAFVIAAQAGVDMIPIRIIYDTPDKHAKLFCRVRICIGTPIPAADLAMEGPRDRAKMKAGKARLAQAWEDLYQANKF